MVNDMSFQWHGFDNGELVWEQEIKRYFFICEQSISTQMPHGLHEEISIDKRIKITKAQAHKFFKKGYLEQRVHGWDVSTAKWKYYTIQLTAGRIVTHVERRELRHGECRPEDVAPPKRKKK